jgi:hypothetical protein
MSHPPIRLLAALAAAASLVLPASALGNGGDDLSTAPEMPTTVRQFSAKFGPDFWKVFLNVGDLMTVDYSSTDGDKVSFCLLPPTVTGATTTPTTTSGFTDTTILPTPTVGTTPILTDDQCAGSDTTFTHNRITLSVVNPPGYWTLVFADGLCAPHNYTTTCTTYDVAYSVTLTVRHFTQTVVAFPTTAPGGRQVTLSGRVIGMTGGYVQISTQRKGKWVVIGLSPIGVNGVFSRVVRLPRDRGLYPYRVTFFGDQDHRPSGRTVAIRVA